MTSREIKDGGPAFPHTRVMADSSGRMQSGLSIRDYFAAQAIPTMIYKCEDRDGGWDPASVAVGCYAVADALLKARSEKEE